MSEYAYSLDGERYHGSFGSAEEAAANGLNDDDRDSVWVGECVPPPQPETFLDAAYILEHVQCQDYYSGEYGEDWPNASKDQEAELTEALQAAFAAWLDRHGLRPEFFMVENVREITRAELEADIRAGIELDETERDSR
jgi:hypothetical protein